MQFTYRNPQRSTDPRARRCRGPLRAGRCTLVLRRRTRRARRAPHGRVARYAWTDHYAPLREGLRAVAHRLRRDGWRAVAFADDNSIVDREVAYRAGLGWFGKNANILLPGAGSWFVLGCVVTTAPLPPPPRRSPTAAGRAAGASMPARPARSSRPGWSTPAAAWRGSCRSRA